MPHRCSSPLRMSVEDTPPYTSSVPAPSYSREPKADEERLAFTARLQCQRRTSQFRRRTRYIALELHEQDCEVAVPVYDNNSLVSGTITLFDCSHVRSVVVKLECHINLNLEAQNSKSKIFSDSYELWAHSSDQTCPKTHDFTIPFSSVYTTEGRTRSPPPSYHTPMLESFSAKCTYQLKIRVFQNRHSLKFWRKTQKLNAILNYRPRTCPPRPILYAPLLYSIKSSPEEWFQIMSSNPTRSNAVTCNMFIPSVQIYSLSDVIPFHIQLSAPLASIRILMGGASGNDIPSYTKSPESIGLRVFLCREISIDVRGHREMRRCHHSEGTLRAVPPPEWIFDDNSAGDEISLDFEGEVQCDGRINSTGFNTDNLIVRDVIVVSWKPSGQFHAPFLPFQQAHEIKLVTNSLTEGVDLPR